MSAAPAGARLNALDAPSARDSGLHRVARRLTIALVPFGLVASTVGLVWNGVYRELELVEAMRGQDLVTLVAMVVLAGALPLVGRASLRATLVWIGLLGYTLYAATGAAFAYLFNELFLVYIALFALSLFALAFAIGGIDAKTIAQHFDAKTPRLAVAAFMVAVALLVAVSELGQILPALLAGDAPDLLIRSAGAGNFVYALDLGVVMPLALIGAVLLMRSSGWGFVLAAALLVKSVTMGLALVSAAWFTAREGIPLGQGLTLAYGAMALGAIGVSFWFFSHCRDLMRGRLP